MCFSSGCSRMDGQLDGHIELEAKYSCGMSFKHGWKAKSWSIDRTSILDLASESQWVGSTCSLHIQGMDGWVQTGFLLHCLARLQVWRPRCGMEGVSRG